MKALEILKRMFAIDEYPSKQKLPAPVKGIVPVEQMAIRIWLTLIRRGLNLNITPYLEYCTKSSNNSKLVSYCH